MERPPVRPEGALIRLAREAGGMSIPEAVRASGISKARWSQVETSRETRNGIVRQVTGKAATIARMARTVGIAPDRLEEEGKRPDAAAVLREILREEPPRPALVPPLPSVPSGSLAEWLDRSPDALIEQFVSRDDVLRQIWALPGPDGEPLDRRKRIRLIEVVLADDDPADGSLPGEMRQDGAGLPPHPSRDGKP